MQGAIRSLCAQAERVVSAMPRATTRARLAILLLIAPLSYFPTSVACEALKVHMFDSFD